MSHEAFTKQTVPTNGATEGTIAIPLDKCFQLDPSVGSIKIESSHEIYFCVYNPTRNPSGINANSGSRVYPNVLALYVVGENTQVGNSDYLVCLSQNSESLTYSVIMQDHSEEEVI
jgi:hypothetical protein